MKKSQTRREFLRKSTLTSSLIFLPGSVSRMAGINESPNKDLQLQNSEPTVKPVSWFSTGGETIYHLRAGKTSMNIQRSIIAAAFSGSVLCFDFSGKKLWEQNSCRFFPFCLDVGDIDNDGLDECVISSADGSLYIIDHNGKLLSKVFEGKPPLYSVKIVEFENSKKGIICGGAERVLYHLSPKGEILTRIATTGAIENLKTGRFFKDEPECLVVGMCRDFTYLDLSLNKLPELEVIGESCRTQQRFIYNMITVDTKGTGLEELAFGGGSDGVILSSDGKLVQRLDFKHTGLGQHVYSMLILDKMPLKNGKGDQLIGLNATSLRLYAPDGTISNECGLSISPAGLSYDKVSGTLLLGSEISGGDCIYCVKMDQPGWQESIKTGYKGKIRQIVSNLEELMARVKAFDPPPYQPKVKTEILTVFAMENASAQTEFPYPNMQFASNAWMSEKRDRSKMPYGWDTKRDSRLKYNLLSSEIIEEAAKLEKEGLPFVWTIGHGNDPFFISLETVEGILLAAPKYCKGFIFPEVARDDTPMYRYAVFEHIKPVCDLCLKHGNRKVILRSKFLFWAGDCYTDLWNWMLKDKKYKDVILPAMEETYERLCDISLSGRVGLWQSGFVTNWAARAVHDNVNYDREHQWAATNVGSHFFRALCYQAGLGSKYFLIQLGETSRRESGRTLEGHGQLVVKPFLHMLGKGILLIPETSQDMLSLSPVALGMKTPKEEFMQASHNSHEITKYKDDPKWVMSRLQSFWAQSPTPEYDFGYYGIGRRKQALNFLPKNPYGLVPIVPGDAIVAKIPGIEKIISTDGEYWYDENGNQRSAIDYANYVEETLKTASKKMFIHVIGDVAWTATRIDNTHVRLVLIDSGYLNPADRSAEVTVNAKTRSATDILNKEKINLKNNSFTVTIPMGILRVIDIEYS